MDSDIVYFLSLKNCPGIGDGIIKKLIDGFGSAEKIWNTSHNDLASLHGIGKKTLLFIGDDSVFKQAEKEFNSCKENNITVSHLYQENYPQLLKECNDAPVILYSQGNINWNFPSLSIVGTRNMTAYGKAFTEKLIDNFSGKEINIISGLALGIDGVAHTKAVELNIPTIGILAHGLNFLYPHQHRSLAQQMLKNGGVISEFPINKKPERAHFIQRNRIIAGVSPVTIIVESAYGGGAISTVKFANSYNREVFALPGKVTDIYSQGCNTLIKNLEAQIITRPKDILHFFAPNTKSNRQTELFTELTPDQKRITDFLKVNGKVQIDILAANFEIPVFQLMPNLLELELKNIIHPLPGKYFELI